jgi:glucose-6-phosphate 1-dehydrogenase
MSTSGWTRLIVEKPFGRDYDSSKKLASELGALFTEDHIYRIDHYLGKEMVQNLIMFRFGNIFLEPLLCSKYVHSVQITFKENFGTEGRGGYFDNFGIIRDVMQNHLTQVLSILAMEPPVQLVGDGSANYIRDAKVRVLQAISPVTVQDVVLGQYVANSNGDIGYKDDLTVPTDSKTPTFCQAIMHVHTPRWEGVPFIMKAGKALDERKSEIRIQFKDAPAHAFLFGLPTEPGSGHEELPRNELVLRLQPTEAVYMKINVKRPGLSSESVQSELDLSYRTR